MKKFRLFKDAQVDVEKMYRPSVYNIDGRISVDSHIALEGWLAYDGEEYNRFFAKKYGTYWVVFRQWDSDNITLNIVNHGDALKDSGIWNNKEELLDIVDQYILYTAFKFGGFGIEVDDITDDILKNLNNIDIPILDILEDAIDSNYLDWNSDSDTALKALYTVRNKR